MPPPGQTINNGHYLSVLCQLRDVIQWKQLQLWAVGDWHHDNVPLMHHIMCWGFWQNIKSPRWLRIRYSPHLVPCDFWLSPKLKSPLKGKKFESTDEIQGNTTGQLMVIGRTVWGTKVPTLKGTEASLSYVHCSLYLVSSPINVSIFHITCLDTFWTEHIYTYRKLFIKFWSWYASHCFWKDEISLQLYLPLFPFISFLSSL